MKRGIGAIASLIRERALDRRSAVLSTPELRHLIEIERSRSDRTGFEFAVIIFGRESRNRERDSAWESKLIAILVRRVRAVDHVGWYDVDHLAALLPATNSAGAETLAREVVRMANEALQAETTGFAVLSYPDHARGDDVSGELNGRMDESDAPGLRDGTSLAVKPAEDLRSIVARRIPVWKRTIDIAGASVGVILLSPLFLLIAGYVKLLSPGPVIFRQVRVGYKGRPFTCLKLRTMHLGADSAGVHRDYYSDLMQSNRPMEKLDSRRDSRIIAGCRILRRAGIDELPQLINVLRGEMTLIGPRPCIPYEAARYLQWHSNRFDVLPGMTGLWQVSGKDHLSFEKMIRLDIRYARTMSLWTDLKILLFTVPAILGMVLEPIVRRRSV